MKTLEAFLRDLNTEYVGLHKEYEELFWISYMGDHSVDARKDAAQAAVDAFQGNSEYLKTVRELKKTAGKKDLDRIAIWERFFERYQTPPELVVLKKKIDACESAVHQKMTTRKEGYIDPKTKKFVAASTLKLSALSRTHPDEKIRKTAWEAREKLAAQFIDEYIELVTLRNQYAQALGYEDFYAFKVEREEGMTKKELFTLFDALYEKLKVSFTAFETLERNMPGLRKPWNFHYFLAGDFTKEEEPYFQFGDALMRWGRSFSALGIDYRSGTLTLDLLDRAGKYSNGFCHWPGLTHFKNGKRVAGTSNFTCNVVPGQVGAGSIGMNTLFHEGGHAAHFLNAEAEEVILNREYFPMTASWAETQSMFLDTMFSSIEWKMRYVKNEAGESYPFDLFERKTKKLSSLQPLRLLSILFVANFEKEIYEVKNLTRAKVLSLAQKNHKKYNNFSVPSLGVLNIPHIYSWESAAAYHGYGLAEIALSQWREYFYIKYGYIVDNPKVGKEMAKVWKLGGGKTFAEFVVIATGKKLGTRAILNDLLASPKKKLLDAKKKLARMKRVKPYTKKVNLNANVRMVHGKEEITNSKKGFERMAAEYKEWVHQQELGVK